MNVGASSLKMLTLCNLRTAAVLLITCNIVVGLQCQVDHDETIHLSPPNLLVPFGTSNVTFLCEINIDILTERSYKIYWNNIVNGQPIMIPKDHSGFSIDPPLERSTNNNQSRLRIVNALDNTTFQCFIEYDAFHDEFPSRNYSNNVTLLVINETSTVKPNPSLEQTTDSSPSLRLLWSPPYLWSGKCIDFFKIAIIRKTDGRSLYTERVDRLIDRAIESIWICQALNYSEGIFFEIKAFAFDRDMNVMLLNGTGNFNETEEFLSGIGNLKLNTRVLIDTNATLVLQLLVELPNLCSYEEINLEYTIVDSDNLGVYNEIFYHIQSNVFYQEMDSVQVNLKCDQEYTLKVKMTQSTLGMKNMTFETLHKFSTVFPFGCSCFQLNRSSFKFLILLVLFVSINNTMHG